MHNLFFHRFNYLTPRTFTCSKITECLRESNLNISLMKSGKTWMWHAAYSTNSALPSSVPCTLCTVLGTVSICLKIKQWNSENITVYNTNITAVFCWKVTEVWKVKDHYCNDYKRVIPSVILFCTLEIVCGKTLWVCILKPKLPAT